MSQSDVAVVRYLELARLSQAKQQAAGAVRFLLLAGVAACRAGWLDVAEGCRETVLEHNAHHLLSHWPNFPEALRDADFQTFLRQLERFCSVEKAEMLLAELDSNTSKKTDNLSREDALQLLSNEVWKPSQEG